jgi:nucleoside 2-deoxyribosyltransferase
MLVYLAHPVGHDPEERVKNLANVCKWFKFFMEYTDWSMCVPWYIYVTNLDESWRKRAMRDDLVNLERCDAIVLTGGRMSEGMKMELGLAEITGHKIFDLISAGYSPEDNYELALKLVDEISRVNPV